MNKAIAFLDKVMEWCIYLIYLFIPVFKSGIEIGFIVAFSCWIVKKIYLKDFTPNKTPLNTAIILFLCANIISLINSEYFLLSLRALFSKTLEYIILFFIIVETIDNKRKLKNLCIIALISLITVCLDAYLQYYVWHVDLFRAYKSFRYEPLTNPYFQHFLGIPTGPFPFPNDLAAWLLMFIMPLFSIFLWGMKDIYNKLILGIILFFSLGLFYLTNVRSSWAAFLGSSSLLFYTTGKKIITFAVIIVLFSMFFLVKYKPSGIVGLSSFKDRISMWQTGFDIFKRHPIMGNGINTFFNEYKKSRKDEFKMIKGSYAHNGYLQIAAETGILGLCFFIFIILSLFKEFFKNARNITNRFYNSLYLGLFMGVLAFLIHSFFDTNLQSLPLVALFWCNMGVLISINNINFEAA